MDAEAPGPLAPDCDSVGVSLALGGTLLVEPGGASFPLRTLFGLDGTLLALLRLLGVLLCNRRMLRRAFALAFGLVMLLRCRDGVSLGFLAMSGGLSAYALALALALAAPGLDHSSGDEQHDSDRDENGDDDGDHGDRRHGFFVPHRNPPHTRKGSTDFRLGSHLAVRARP